MSENMSFFSTQMGDASDGEAAVPLMFFPSRIPVQRDRRTDFQKKVAVRLILISAALERLAFYSLAGNLTFFLTADSIGWIFPYPLIASLIFLGKINTKNFRQNEKIVRFLFVKEQVMLRPFFSHGLAMPNWVVLEQL